MKFENTLIPKVLAVAVCLCVTANLRAEDPQLNRLSPPGFQRGTEVELLLSGARLGDANQLLIYEDGIEVVEVLPVDDNKVWAKLRIDPQCQPGLYSLRLATKSGLSNLRYFGISAMPQIEESEPNDEFEKPQPVELNQTINGLCKTEDVDYYCVELQAGQKVTVELEGLRLGTEFFDPFVAILDSNRFEVASSDDAPLLQQDCVCAYTAKEAGVYTILVRESSFGGNDNCQYRLHVGDFPRPLAIVPAGGQPGQVISATITDVNGDRWTEDIQLPETPGNFDYVAERDGKIAPSPNRLRVLDVANYVEVETEDRASLMAVELPAAFNGVLSEAGDVDWFKVVGKKDQQLEFNVFARRVLRTPLDSWLEIHKASGGRLAANDDAGGPDSSQVFKFPEDGEYLIAIRDQLNEGSAFHAYRIEVAPPSPGLDFTFDELRRYESQVLEVPQGGQMAVLMRANRRNFGGDLDLQLIGAPAGVELVTPKVAANQGYIPFMLRAPAESEPAAALTRLVAQTPPESANVTGEFLQRTMLVRGQNNVDVWGHDATKMAVAITNKLPFRIEVEQPKVPLVRSGNAEYVVRLTRDEGFEGPVSLRVLYDPPGCRASGSVKIEKDQTEARIPITANENAALGVFPITILARANVNKGGVWQASEFINLEVADSYFNFTFPKSVAEQGAKSVVNVGVELKRPLDADSSAQFELVGLPAGVASPAPITPLVADATQVAYPIEVAADARAGQFKSLVIRATITTPNGQIVQTTGTGEIQIAEPIAAAVVANEPAPTVAPTERPLSRLEQLRQAK